MRRRCRGWRPRTPSAATTRRCSPTCCAARPSCAGPERRSSATSATARTCASGSAPTPASACAARIAICSRSTGRSASGVRYDATLAARPRRRRRRGCAALLADARVVSIVGPGGLGKTRLAHVARARRRPAGGARRRARRRHRGRGRRRRGRLRARRARLGQRAADADAGAARRRPRAASRSGSAQSPSLLVLDNCEHVVERGGRAGGVPRLRDRRPAGAHDEPRAARDRRRARLPARRARAGRRGRSCSASARSRRGPGAQLTRRRRRRASSTRLDGLPLAIELAAAKVRAMAVEEIDRRLEDRFALLRGGDRSAPDRHRTLLAVIDWSWNLLDEAERRALRRLALFNDGFTLEAADAVLGDGAARRGPGPRRPVAAERARGAGGRPLPDAGDRARVRPAAARGGRRGRRRARGPAAAGRSPTRAAAAPGCSAATSSRRSTRSPPRRSTSPTSCATRSPTATAARWSSCSPRSGSSGRSAASTRRLIALTAGGRRRGRAAGSRRPELEDAARAALAIALMQRADDGRPARRAAPRRCWRGSGPGGGDPRLAGWCRCCWRTTRRDARPRSPAGSSGSPADPDRHVAHARAASWLGHVRENDGDPAARSRRPSARWRSSAATRARGRRRCSSTSSPS